MAPALLIELDSRAGRCGSHATAIRNSRLDVHSAGGLAETAAAPRPSDNRAHREYRCLLHGRMVQPDRRHTPKGKSGSIETGVEPSRSGSTGPPANRRRHHSRTARGSDRLCSLDIVALLGLEGAENRSDSTSHRGHLDRTRRRTAVGARARDIARARLFAEERARHLKDQYGCGNAADHRFHLPRGWTLHMSKV
jgi:hypothetical protein